MGNLLKVTFIESLKQHLFTPQKSIKRHQSIIKIRKGIQQASTMKKDR